jgi:hypothetical protein
MIVGRKDRFFLARHVVMPYHGTRLFYDLRALKQISETKIRITRHDYTSDMQRSLARHVGLAPIRQTMLHILWIRACQTPTKTELTYFAPRCDYLHHHENRTLEVMTGSRLPSRPASQSARNHACVRRLCARRRSPHVVACATSAPASDCAGADL